MRPKLTVLQVTFPIVVVLAWYAIAQAGIWNPMLFPGPDKVAQTLWTLSTDGSLGVAIGTSLQRLLTGYLISLSIAVPLGVMLARRQWVRDTIGTFVVGFQSLPSICWLPLALLWFGLTDTAILFVVVMGSMISITVAVQDGVKNINPVLIRAGRTMGYSGFHLAKDVLLPAALPALLLGAKLGWSYAWRALMAGELLFVSMGLGHTLMMGRELADMSQVLTVMGVIMALGLLSDALLFGVAEKRMRVRWGMQGA